MHGQACLLEQLVHLALQQEAGGWRRRGGRVVGGAGCGGWRRGCGLAGRGHRAAAAVHQKPGRTRGDQRRRQCGPDQHQPGPAAGELLIGLPRPAPEGSDGQVPRRGEGGAGCWWSLARQRLRHGAREHRLGLARLDVGRQHREYPALERGSQLLLGRPVREDQHHGARHLRLRGVDGGAHIGDLARVDRQDLAAFGARHAAQGVLEGFDRPHRGLSAEGLAQFEQKVIAAGESGDVYHRPGILGCAAGSAGRGFGTAGGSRWCAGHLRCLQTKTAE